MISLRKDKDYFFKKQGFSRKSYVWKQKWLAAASLL